MFVNKKVVISDDKVSQREFKTSVKYTKYDFYFYKFVVEAFISLNKETNEIDFQMPPNINEESKLCTVKINDTFEYQECIFEIYYKWFIENIHKLSKPRAHKIFKDAENTLKECIDEYTKLYEHRYM